MNIGNSVKWRRERERWRRERDPKRKCMSSEHCNDLYGIKSVCARLFTAATAPDVANVVLLSVPFVVF